MAGKGWTRAGLELLLRLPLGLLGLLGVLLTPLAGSAQTLQLNVPELEVHGGFQVRHSSGVDFLDAVSGATTAPAAGSIVIPHAGTWHVWVQSRSLPTESVTARRFSLRLGTERLVKSFGGHRLSSHLDFVWEDGGTVNLAAGPLLLVLGEDVKQNAQCSRILLTEEQGQPDPGTLLARAQTVKMVPLGRDRASASAEPGTVTAAPTAKAQATLTNARLRVSFLPVTLPDQYRAVVQQLEVRTGTGWRKLPMPESGDSYKVVFRPPGNDPHLSMSSQFPSWDQSFAPPVTYTAGVASLQAHEGPATAPWLAGQLLSLRPTGATQVDSETVDLAFDPLPIGRLTARWHLIPGQPSASLTLSLALTRPGWLSLGYHGVVEKAPQDLDFLMLGYMYLGHRFPLQAVTISSDRAPTPAAMVTLNHLSYAIMAEPGVIPFAWPGQKQARYGFGIRNERGLAEPLAYSPILGSSGSLHRTPEKATAQFRIWAQEGGWIETYREMVTQAFGLRDYRVPVTASLSDTVLNLAKLLEDDDKSGWNARAKGSWNIESRETVTQPSPLTYLSYAMLTGKEEFYRKYALPSLEFMLSRPEAHFAAAPGSTYESAGALPLGGPNTAYTCGVYAAAYRMTQGATPAFADACFKPDGSLNTHRSHYAAFDDELEMYEATGNRARLAAAIESGDHYIAENLMRLPDRDLGDEPFINVSFVPDWEGLLRLYEATRKSGFLEASRKAAYWLMATVWTQPSIPPGDVTTHPGNSSGLTPLLWWKGDHRFRLGFYDQPAKLDGVAFKIGPEIAVPQASVPSWEVSNVGLGLEQPETYVQAKNNLNIMMSVWAPNLLRLYGHTGDPLFRTYARNATIGRFANYPGYYLSLFDHVHQMPDYPLTGPDLTYFYYHHIAPFAAYVQDYVFTDAEVRSQGKFIFPAARQFGYVWFDSLLRGFAPGTVYGETAWPWVNGGAAVADNKNVDVVLAQNEHTLFVALMNQTAETQQVSIRLDERMLAARRHGSATRLWVDNTVQKAQRLEGGTLQLEMHGREFAVVAVDGLTLHVTGHEAQARAIPPLEPGKAWVMEVVAGSALKAMGTEIVVPQFRSRELYVYIKATRQQCAGATLVYGGEHKVSVNQFPCEFSAPLPYGGSPVGWRVEGLKTESGAGTPK